MLSNSKNVTIHFKGTSQSQIHYIYPKVFDKRNRSKDETDETSTYGGRDYGTTPKFILTPNLDDKDIDFDVNELRGLESFESQSHIDIPEAYLTKVKGSFVEQDSLTNNDAVELITSEPIMDLTERLQSFIDATPKRYELILPNCTFSVGDLLISKPIHLKGQTKTNMIVRGSIWLLSDGVVEPRSPGKDWSQKILPVNFIRISNQPSRMYKTNFEDVIVFTDCRIEKYPFDGTPHENPQDSVHSSPKFTLSRVGIRSMVQDNNNSRYLFKRFKRNSNHPLFMIAKGELRMDTCILKGLSEVSADFLERCWENNLELSSAPKPQLSISSCSFFDFNSLGCIHLSNLAMEGCYFGSFTGVVLKLMKSQISLIKGCTFEKCKETCIDISDATFVKGKESCITVEDCRFNSSEGVSIQLMSSHKTLDQNTAMTLYLRDCSFMKCKDSGIVVKGSNNTLDMKRCEFALGRNHQVVLEGVERLNSYIEKCKFMNSYQSGIRVENSYVRIDSCLFAEGRFGISLVETQKIDLLSFSREPEKQLLIFITNNEFTRVCEAGVDMQILTSKFTVAMSDNKMRKCYIGLRIGREEGAENLVPSRQLQQNDESFFNLDKSVKSMVSEEGAQNDGANTSLDKKELSRHENKLEMLNPSTLISGLHRIVLLNNDICYCTAIGVRLIYPHPEVFISGGRILNNEIADISSPNQNKIAAHNALVIDSRPDAAPKLRLRLDSVGTGELYSKLNDSKDDKGENDFCRLI